MIPVKQSKLYAKDGIHNGNCFAACLASVDWVWYLALS